MFFKTNKWIPTTVINTLSLQSTFRYLICLFFMATESGPGSSSILTLAETHTSLILNPKVSLCLGGPPLQLIR